MAIGNAYPSNTYDSNQLPSNVLGVPKELFQDREIRLGTLLIGGSSRATSGSPTGSGGRGRDTGGGPIREV